MVIQRASLAVAVLTAAAVIWSAADSTVARADVSYSALTNLGSPATPTAWNHQSNGTWDVLTEARDLDAGNSMAVPPFAAQHAADCSNSDTGPIPTHTVTARTDEVFVCKNHLMTSLNSDDYGYGVIYLTPPALADFSQGTAIDFDSSTFRTSDRDWWDVWLTPFSENFAAPLAAGFPDLNGPPKDSLHIVMNEFNSGTIFNAELYSNFNEQDLPTTGDILEQYVTPSVVNRAQFELRLTPQGGSKYRVQFGLPTFTNGQGVVGHWFIDDVVSLPFSNAVVQLGQHSYTPSKDAGCGPTIEDEQKGMGCTGDTWHWSNFSISNSIPFTIDPGTPDTIGDTSSAVDVHLAQPAPANGFLRFGARAGSVSVSFDGGKTFQPAGERQQIGTGMGTPSVDNSHLANYWMPIPAGVSDVKFKGTGGWWGSGDWYVQDVAVWSSNAPENLPAPAPSPTVAPTVAPSAPAATPTPAPRPTPGPTPAPSHHKPPKHHGWHIGWWTIGPWQIGPMTIG